MSEGEPRVGYETRSNGTIAVISMLRERYRNPLSQQMMEELEVAFDRAAEEDDVRVIILRGEGPTFTTGHDLGSPDAAGMRERRQGQSMAGNYDRTRGIDIDPHLKWRNIPKPTIAMVQGDCIYAAWMLASAMDVVIAADDAQFLPTNSQYFAVPWDIGARRAKYLMFDNRFLSADEALDWGLVQEVHPIAELEAATMAYAERVAQQDPFQIRMMKHSIHQMQEMQGFTAHILSSFSDRMVRAANDVSVTEEGADGGRRLYLSVERARAHRAASEDDTSVD